MQTEPSLAVVRRRTAIDSTAGARAATGAVLETLGERVGRGEATAVAGQLPTEYERLLEPIATSERQR